MEGIRDGQAVDSCFYCALLYPKLAECPRCEKRLHYRSASMAPTLSPEEQCEELVKLFQEDSSRQNAVLLLELLHQYPEELPHSERGPNCPTIQALRQAFEQESDDG